MLIVLVLAVDHSIFCIFQTNQQANTNSQLSFEIKITSAFFTQEPL